ncbi:MAG: DUF1501 domain-containing protein [Verrucomicrobiales bacterium]|nr:DUF1501 domain-containing protein [Verrucomicrobiae bacterium]MCP5552258.1 DUF1501 domain-containing protein [Akkermansiaceae bacterium]
MATPCRSVEHVHSGISPLFSPAGGDLIRVGSTRRGFLQTGLKGIAGVSLPSLLQCRALGAAEGSAKHPTSVILFWLSGGPSHIDMWDPKPDAPREIRGPFGSIPTKLPGVHVCEHLPLTAKLMDKLTLIRSVDCSASNHTPITMQACNPLARRTNDGKDGDGWPSMGAIAAKFRGANAPGMPGFVGLADSWVSDVWGAGAMGHAFEPANGKELAGRLKLSEGVTIDRLGDRRSLLGSLDGLKRRIETSEQIAATDEFTHQAYDVLLSGRAQKAFNLEEESATMRDFYGRDSMGEKALLARRLVEAGVTFTLVSGAWGYFDHHGDAVRWGGIEKGLKPLLPSVDRTLHAIVTDLESRGLLDSTLVLMMGEFGRGPVINKDAGRDHWPRVMSMVMAGGGLRHGQVIGSTDKGGYDIASRRVGPQDLAATVFRHLGIDPGSHWTDPQGRPRPIVVEGGKPIAELV